MSDRAAVIGLVGILVVGVVAFAFVIDRATVPEPVTASVDPYTASNLEAKLDRLIEQGDAQLTASAPTATATVAARAVSTVQVIDWCPLYGIASQVDAGEICLIPRPSPTPAATWTPILPCALATPKQYTDVPCEWDGE